MATILMIFLRSNLPTYQFFACVFVTPLPLSHMSILQLRYNVHKQSNLVHAIKLLFHLDN